MGIMTSFMVFLKYTDEMWQDNNINSVAEPTDLTLVLATAVVTVSFAYISEIETMDPTNFSELAGATGSFIACIWG